MSGAFVLEGAVGPAGGSVATARRLQLLRAAVVLATIGAAYHYSLLTLTRNIALETPLAYLGLVPIISLVLATLLGRRWRWEPDVHDRYVDYIIGIPLLLAGLAVVVIVPVVLSSFFWRWRLDLLSLPVFVAATVTLVFGLRTTLRLRPAIVFLCLAWPLPYTLLINDWLQTYTTATLAGVKRLLELAPLASFAQPIDGSDGSLFLIGHGADGFVVSVASACSGVNGSVGFLLVGAAFATLLRGGLLRKLAWLGGGMAVTWAINLARILGIFAAGGAWGQDFALNTLHPVVGLVTFNIGVVAMVLALPLFGLRVGAPAEPPAVAGPPAGDALARRLVPRRLPVQRAAIALVLVVLSGLTAGLANDRLRGFELTAADLGQPRLSEWTAALAGVDGWTVQMTNSYPWVEQYFGRGATWNRYAYLSDAAAPSGPDRALDFVNVDVISTWDLGTFSTYGLEACYGFHNYQIVGTDRVDLGAGVVGHTVVYYNPSTSTSWTALYWEWPVAIGDRERYERVILNVTTISPAAKAAGFSDGPFSQVQLSLAALLAGSSGRPTDPESVRIRDFIVGFGHDLVLARSEESGTGASMIGPGS